MSRDRRDKKRRESSSSSSSGAVSSSGSSSDGRSSRSWPSDYLHLLTNYIKFNIIELLCF